MPNSLSLAEKLQLPAYVFHCEVLQGLGLLFSVHKIHAGRILSRLVMLVKLMCSIEYNKNANQACWERIH